MNARISLRIAGAAPMLALSGMAAAQGFAVPEISIAGLGLSNAIVANTDEKTAIAYNPAIAALQSGHSLSGGLMLVAPSLKVTTGTGTHESQGDDITFIPMGQLAYQWNRQTTLTLGINAPFGLETVWDDSAPVFATLAPTGLHPTKSEIQLLDVSPALSFKLSDQLAVAVGADLYWVKKVVFDSTIAQNEGDGTGWGWNAAMVYDSDPWSFGLAYHSEAEADVEGTSTFFAPFPLPGSYAATAEVPVPSRLQAGFRYRASKQLAVEFDITVTGWSHFDVLTIDNAVNPITSTNNWQDANAYRLGVSYQLDRKTRLRFGYTFDETGQPDEHFSARIPDADRHLFSIGLNRAMGNGLELDAGYMYVRFKDRDYNSTTPLTDSDPNGTSTYNGLYEANVHLFGIGITKNF